MEENLNQEQASPHNENTPVKSEPVMSDEAKILQNDCSNLKDSIKNISQRYHSKLSEINKCEELQDDDSCERISHLLNKAANRSKEYENGSFIVLVVGPAKSGKSTLVNLIANKYVSPTHFLECTVRPSIISKSKDGNGVISVYNKIRSDKEVGKIEQMDFIIDCIRNIEEKNETSLKSYGISERQYELTRDNIENYVRLNLNSSSDMETILTSITTPGGELMKDNVFLVDMPGFDGALANIDDEIYQTIAERADLIVFVQSSNAAMSKVSTDFLKILEKNNRAVPVCLIHNFFESSYWRSEEDKAKELADHLKEAIDFIRSKGFTIKDEHCFNINLGKVTDVKDPRYSNLESLITEAEKYKDLEVKLYKRVIDNSDAMRFRVCLSRTRQQIRKTSEIIDEELLLRSRLVERYEQVNNKFEKLRDSSPFQTDVSPLVVDFLPLKNAVLNEAGSLLANINMHRNHMSKDYVKGVVTDFIHNCENAVSNIFKENLSINQKEEELFLIFKNRITEIKGVVVDCSAKPQPIEIETHKKHIKEVPNISLSPGVNLDLLIPDKFRVPGIYGGHSAEDLVGYINRIVVLLANPDPNDINSTTCYIEKEHGAIYPVLSEINQFIANTLKEYEKESDDYLQVNRNKVLSNIISDKKIYDQKTKLLDELKNQL